MYIHRQAWLGGLSKINAKDSDGESVRDESTGEQLWCKKQYLCSLYSTLSLASLSPRLCLCTESMPETTETNNAMMRYTKSLTPSPTVAGLGGAERRRGNRATSDVAATNFSEVL